MNKWLLTNLMIIVSFGIASVHLLQVDFSNTVTGRIGGHLAVAITLLCLLGLILQFQMA